MTVSHHTEPSEDEILAAESGLAAQGLSGWLAVIEENYWAKSAKLLVMVVRPLAHPSVLFETAVAAFKAARAEAILPT